MIRLMFALILALAFAPGLAVADPVSAAIVTWATSAAFVATTAGAMVVAATTFALSSAAAWALGKVAGPKAAKAQDRQASVISLQLGEGPREAIFGEAASAGQLLDAFNYGGSYGTDWETLVIGLADHRCEVLVGFYIGDTYYAFAGDGLQGGFNNQLSITWHDGQLAQAADASLIANSGGRWTSSDNLAGVAYVVVSYKADAPNASSPVWPQGRPSFLWRVKGARVYDPRKDSTVAGGSGSHRWATPSTWEWSDNAYLCRYAYTRGIYAGDQVADPAQLLIGRGLTAEQAPPERVAAYANVCDELVTLKAGGTEKRYRVGGVVRADESFIGVEEMFADAMAGVIVQRDGGVEIEPGVAKAAVVTFTDADLPVGQLIRVEQFLSDADRVNTVTPRYTEPEQAWRNHVAPVRRSTADITDDGGTREKVLPLSLVTSQTQAQRCGEIERRLSRFERRAAIVLGPRFAYLEDGDWVSWQSARYFGGATVTFRVEAATLDEAYRTQLLLREIASSAYSWTAATDEGAPLAAPVDEPGSLTALVLSGVSIVALSLTGDSGLVTPAIKATWTTPLDAAITGVRIEVRKAGGTDFATDVQLDPGAGKLITTNGVVALTGMEARLIPVSTFGRRCTPTSWVAVTTGAIDAGGSDVPSANLWRKQDYAVSGAATSIDPAFGVSNWGFRFTGPAVGAVTVAGKTFGLNVTPDFARYSLAFRHKLTTGSGAATLRVGFRTSGGAAIADVADQVVTVSTTEGYFTWPNIRSTDPNFATAKFEIFANSGDVASGKVADVADVSIVYGDTAPLGFSPSPDDPAGLTLAGAGTLATQNDVAWATQVTGSGKPADNATKNLVYRQNSAPSSPTTNDIWCQLDGVGNPIAIWVYNGSSWINGADRTVYNTAAAITGQGAWATASVPSGLTPTQVNGRTQYFDSGSGQLYDYRGVMWGYSVDGVAGRGVQPISTGVGSVSVAAHSINFPTTGGYTSISIPSYSQSGLSNDTNYTVFYRPAFGTWFVVQSIFSAAFKASLDNYLYVGEFRTPLSGGSYTAATTDYSTNGVYDELCVSADAILASGQRAGDAQVGDPLTLMAPSGDFLLAGEVEANHAGQAPGFRLTTAGGVVLTVSDSAPIMTRIGPGGLPYPMRAAECEPGLAVPTCMAADPFGDVVWDVLASVEPVGPIVVARISAKGVGVYAASDVAGGPYLLTHNRYSKA